MGIASQLHKAIRASTLSVSRLQLFALFAFVNGLTGFRHNDHPPPFLPYATPHHRRRPEGLQSGLSAEGCSVERMKTQPRQVGRGIESYRSLPLVYSVAYLPDFAS